MLLAATVLSLASSPRPARRVPQRRFVVQGGAFVVAAAAAPRAAVGWCGEAVPSWAFFVKWDDGRVPFEWEGAKGEAYCRVVGDRAREAKAGVPPILLVGTPGLGYDYLENLEALTVSDRRVVEVVFAGTNGAASAPLLTADACAAQLGAVVRSLGVQKADTCQTLPRHFLESVSRRAAGGWRYADTSWTLPRHAFWARPSDTL